MMMIKRYFSAIPLLLLFSSAFAQNTDFGIWYGASLKHEIVKNLDIEASGMLRTFENASKTDQWFLEIGTGYKLNDYLSIAGSYRFIRKLEDDLQLHLQHKIFVDVKGTLKLSDISFTARLRYQVRYSTYFEYIDDKIPDQTLRLKFKGTYKTSSSPVNPYLYFESFIPLNKEPERFVGKNRIAAGAELKIIKGHSVEAEYIFERDWLPNISDISIISIGYNLQF
jgi:hypothetical protein